MSDEIKHLGAPTVSLPDGHVCVALRECDGPDGRQLAVISLDGTSGRGMQRVTQSPSDYRVVPQTMVDEYAALCRRHDAELEQIWARLYAAPSFKVTVSLTA